MIIESFQQQLLESEEHSDKLAYTVSIQTNTIDRMMEEKQDVLQRLDDEVEVRYETERILEEENNQLNLLLEEEISKRCTVENDRNSLHRQLSRYEIRKKLKLSGYSSKKK